MTFSELAVYLMIAWSVYASGDYLVQKKQDKIEGDAIMKIDEPLSEEPKQLSRAKCYWKKPDEIRRAFGDPFESRWVRQNSNPRDDVFLMFYYSGDNANDADLVTFIFVAGDDDYYCAGILYRPF